MDLDVFHGIVEELHDFSALQPQPIEPTELEMALQEIAALKKEKAELVKRASGVVSAVVELSELL